MALSIISSRRSSSQVISLWLIPLLCCVLISFDSANGQQAGLPDFGGLGQQLQGFGSGLMENVQNFGRQFSSSASPKSKDGDSSSFSPDKVLTRVREGFSKGVENVRSFGSQLMDPNKRLADRTMGLLDRIMGRFDSSKKKGGKDAEDGGTTGPDMGGMFNKFLGSVRNIVQRMSSRVSGAAGGKKEGKGKMDESDAQTIAELNAALKQLDKESKKVKSQ